MINETIHSHLYCHGTYHRFVNWTALSDFLSEGIYFCTSAAVACVSLESGCLQASTRAPVVDFTIGVISPRSNLQYNKIGPDRQKFAQNGVNCKGPVPVWGYSKN